MTKNNITELQLKSSMLTTNLSDLRGLSKNQFLESAQHLKWTMQVLISQHEASPVKQNRNICVQRSHT